MKSLLQRLKALGILPVVKVGDAAQAPDLARALCRGGLPAAEVTFRTPAAAAAIAAIRREVPEVWVAAGTVRTVGQAQAALEAGAQAIVSPGTNPDVVRYCQGRNAPVIPGCATPTEIEAAAALGLTTFKLFPAEVAGGVALLRALYGPYPDVAFLPTGGISPGNVAAYLAQPNVLACGGTWMAPEALLRAGDFERIEQLAREAAALRRG